MASLLGVECVAKDEKYLGLPTLVGRNKRQCFGFLKERIWKKLQSWKGKFLNLAGKEILIKVVAQLSPSTL